MYPPERRARGISYVLFGAVFGAILGPAVFGPLFSGRELDAAALTVPWLAAAGDQPDRARRSCASCGPDPKRIAELHRAADDPASPQPPAAPLREILRRPGVRPAMLAALASFGVMVSVMNLTRLRGRRAPPSRTSPTCSRSSARTCSACTRSCSFVGALIDRIGRPPALAAGPARDGARRRSGCCGFESVLATAVLLFGLGVGWNVSFVAATAQLADRTERGRARAADRLQRPAVRRSSAPASRCSAATRWTRSASPRSRIGATAIVAAPVLWLAPRIPAFSR